MSRDSVLKGKSFAFAVRIVKLSKYLRKDFRECVLSVQILRAGTAVGALIREAEHAESRKDFIHKLNIGLKEINECEYWIDLLFVTKFLTAEMYESLNKDCRELLRMLIASIKTTKKQELENA